MARGRRYWWLVVVVLVTGLDIVGRLVLAFDMARVAAFESVLFAGTFVLVSVIKAKYRPTSVVVSRVERGLAAAFGLAGVRAVVWAVGAGVAAANLVAFVTGVALAIGFVLRKRYVTRRRTA